MLKKGAKIWLLTGIILFVTGMIILAAIYLTRGSLIPQRFDVSNTFEEKIYTANPSQLNGIVFNDLNNDIVIMPSEDENIYIEYYESDLCSYDIVETEGVVTFEYKEKGFLILDIFNFCNTVHRNTVTVLIPNDMQAFITLTTVNGSIRADNLAGVASLSISTVNGEVETNDIVSNGDISLNATNGYIYAGDIVCNKANISTINGVVELVRLSAEELSISNVNGNISLDEAAAHSIYCTTTSADVIMNGISADYIQTSSVNGDINMNINAKSQDYNINASTINGDIRCAGGNDAALKKLDLSTVNGDVEVVFTQD